MKLLRAIKSHLDDAIGDSSVVKISGTGSEAGIVISLASVEVVPVEWGNVGYESLVRFAINASQQTDAAQTADEWSRTVRRMSVVGADIPDVEEIRTAPHDLALLAGTATQRGTSYEILLAFVSTSDPQDVGEER